MGIKTHQKTTDPGQELYEALGASFEGLTGAEQLAAGLAIQRRQGWAKLSARAQEAFREAAAALGIDGAPF